jgi:hypothetical protein
LIAQYVNSRCAGISRGSTHRGSIGAGIVFIVQKIFDLFRFAIFYDFHHNTHDGKFFLSVF